MTKMEEERLRAIEAKIKGLRREAEELLAFPSPWRTEEARDP